MVERLAWEIYASHSFGRRFALSALRLLVLPTRNNVRLSTELRMSATLSKWSHATHSTALATLRSTDVTPCTASSPHTVRPQASAPRTATPMAATSVNRLGGQ